MFTLYDEEQIRKNHEASIVKEAEEKGRMEGRMEAAFNMNRKGYAEDVIADLLEIDLNTVKEWLSA